MKNNKIPIVFAFDDNYALPASIAIQSLVDCAQSGTQYDIFVLHSGLKQSVMRKIEKIHPINWIRVDASMLKDAPMGWSGIETYFRLLVADLIPQYDKIIWSDVDVLFRGDLTDIYNMSIDDADWAGIIAERADEKNGIHPHYPENTHDFIYMPGFMIINARQWRDENRIKTFFDIINKFGARLKFFDLDVLNLGAGKIAPVPFEYCVLERIYDNDDIKNAPEYPWLARAHSHAVLVHAKENPMIIHYAGGWPKIWMRKYNDIPKYYWEYIKKSPFYNNEFYFPGIKTRLNIIAIRILKRICPVKKWRQQLKQKRTKYEQRQKI